ncbi:unnamed protein product [Amoebophrya sp. A25]|nr:unnamed protein product [Amoebophrya sp. A25]|eukprot:GSA25T00006041001.1
MVLLSSIVSSTALHDPSSGDAASHDPLSALFNSEDASGPTACCTRTFKAPSANLYPINTVNVVTQRPRRWSLKDKLSHSATSRRASAFIFGHTGNWHEHDSITTLPLPEKGEGLHDSDSHSTTTKTSFGTIWTGGVPMGDSGPYPKRDTDYAGMPIKVFPAAQTACDPTGGIRLDQRSLVARDGKFCDSVTYPLNTVCVRHLPQDWCPSVRPRTTFLPPKWRPVFVNEKSVNPVSGITELGPTWYQNAVAADPIEGQKREVLVDQGDVCCPVRYLKSVALPDPAGGKDAKPNAGGDGLNTPVRHCEDHWNKPWCVTPAALYRYMINHPGWKVDVDCAATSQPRIGVLGAICEQQDRERLAAAAYKERMGDDDYARQYEELMKRQSVNDPAMLSDGKETQEESLAKDRAVLDVTSTTPPGAPASTEPGFFGIPDPRRAAGGLGSDMTSSLHGQRLIRPGADFGIYGGESVVAEPLEFNHAADAEHEQASGAAADGDGALGQGSSAHQETSSSSPGGDAESGGIHEPSDLASRAPEAQYNEPPPQKGGVVKPNGSHPRRTFEEISGLHPR